MSVGGRRVVVLPDAEAVARRAAEEFSLRSRDAVSARGRFAAALSGGSTPRRVYALLGNEAAPFRREIPWERVHLFWGDERPVPPTDPESNYRMVRETLLSKVALPEGNVHRIAAELGPDVAAAAYEEELRRFFELAAGEVPRFDLAFLGMGADGHTASLFPGSPALAVEDRLVVAARAPRLDSHRITLTLLVFNAAAAVIFLVCGAEKARTLAAVLDPASPPDAFPCQRIRPRDGDLIWLVDRPAAAALPKEAP